MRLDNEEETAGKVWQNMKGHYKPAPGTLPMGRRDSQPSGSLCSGPVVLIAVCAELPPGSSQRKDGEDAGRLHMVLVSSQVPNCTIVIAN